MSFHHSPSIVKNGLVLCLDAKDLKSYSGSGTTWTDRSGLGNNGTLVNGVGYSDGAMVFDGVDDAVVKTTIANDSLDISSVTCSLWFNSNSLPVGSIDTSVSYLISKNLNAGSVDQQYSIVINSTTIRGSIGGIYTPVTTSYNFSNNKWYNIGITYGANIISLYVNGIVLLTTSQTPNITFKPNFSIGRRSSANDGSTGLFLFDGKISAVSIYNRALSPAEILQNYNATKSRFQL